MGKCHVCANEYDKTFEITIQNKSYCFDSFECAIHALAPQCDHCGCKIIGHGLEENQHFYCCAHCARQHGIKTLHDRA
jgi:hypothetical protein